MIQPAQPTRRVGAPPPAEPDPMQVFFELFDGIINRVFAMNFQAGLIRLGVVAVVGIFIWVIIAFGSNAPTGWQTALLAIFNPALTPDVQDPIAHFLWLTFGAFFGIPVIMHLLAWIIPFFLALQLAAVFLDDIFELRNVRVARRFITQAAFVYPTFGVIHVEEGDVRPSDKKSPIFQIGGPGRVRVSVENLAVFEKIDGTPEVIGPTSAERFFTRNLDGFERIRAVIDLRDLTIPIPDLEARTKDGVRISVQNIRLLFSVLRNTPAATINRPYTYSEDAILNLIYDQGKNNWFIAMTSLVRNELISFISEHTLTEVFAAVGEPEVNRHLERQRIVQNHIYQVRNRTRRYRALDRLRSREVPRAVIARPVRRYPKQRHPNLMEMRRPRRYTNPFRPRPVSLGLRQPRSTSPGGLHMNLPRHPSRWKRSVALPFRTLGSAGRHFRKARRQPVLFNQGNLLPIATPGSVPRLEVSRRFYEEFARAFPARARQRGVRLQWIDVGTWHLPRSLQVFDRHMDAWMMTVENMARSDVIVLSELRFMGMANEILRMMRRPIFRFIELSQEPPSREEMVFLMVEEYAGMLRAMRDQMLRDGQQLPDRLVQALEHIQRYQRARLERSNRARYISTPSNE